MAIDMRAVEMALGDKFDPQGDYAVCGYNDRAMMLGKGYREVGTIQDPSPDDRDLLIFDRKPVEPSFVKKMLGKVR